MIVSAGLFFWGCSNPETGNPAIGAEMVGGSAAVDPSPDTVSAKQDAQTVCGRFQSLDFGDYLHFNMLTSDSRELSFWVFSIPSEEMARFEQDGMTGTAVEVQWRRVMKFIPEAGEELEIDELVSIKILDPRLRECSDGSSLIPEIDLNAKETDEVYFSGQDVAGGVASGVVGGMVTPNADQAYFDFQVEKPVAPIPGTGAPRYPDILRSAGVEGEVLAQFVVDTLGRVDISSYKVIRTSHELFAASLRAALPAMRFMPAEVGGRKVKQLVQQPFVFALQR